MITGGALGTTNEVHKYSICLGEYTTCIINYVYCYDMCTFSLMCSYNVYVALCS